MKTSIQGKPAEWTDEIRAKWDSCRSDPAFPPGVVISANYFHPRPYRNEYDKGSTKEGFVYTVRTSESSWGNDKVWQVILGGGDECD